MKSKKYHDNVDSWARLRFSVIGGLLSSPPAHGELRLALDELSSRMWRHPHEENSCLQFTASTIERWYYKARGANDPLAALARQIRSDVGQSRVISPAFLQALKDQYKAHCDWSYQLHYDNLHALVLEHSELGSMPSYSTVKRQMKHLGLRPRKRVPNNPTAGQVRAAQRLDEREVRSFEMSYVHGLWHLDYHHGRRKIIDRCGEYHIPKALCILDDCSRLCCHMQWYLDETANTLVHGVSQALYKRGMPRVLLTDNGSAMRSQEFRNGLERLGIVHEFILAHSPFQNGKQETMWSQVEGRLMKMLNTVEPLTLKDLNDATQAWAEMEYNRSVHSELSMSPFERMMQEPGVGRSAPSVEEVRFAFCDEVNRKQRRSDGTVSIEGVRFEVPWQFNHRDRLRLRYQSWDLSVAFIVDERSGNYLARIFPLDKRRNADARRRRKDRSSSPQQDGNGKKSNRLPVLLRRYIQEYSATGLPPAYIPTESSPVEDTMVDKKEEDKHV